MISDPLPPFRQGCYEAEILSLGAPEFPEKDTPRAEGNVFSKIIKGSGCS